MSMHQSKNRGLGTFPFNGNVFGGFSIQWKKIRAFFHSMETFGAIFPFNGKIWAWFSTQWKNFGAIFQSMETRTRREGLRPFAPYNPLYNLACEPAYNPEFCRAGMVESSRPSRRVCGRGLIVLLLLCSAAPVLGQDTLVRFVAVDVSGNAATQPPSILVDHLSITGGGMSGTEGGNVLKKDGTSAWSSQEHFGYAPGGGAYQGSRSDTGYVLTIEADAGYTFDLDSILFRHRATAAGPGTVGVRVGGVNYSGSNDSVSTTVREYESETLNLTGLTSVTIVIQGWGSSGTGNGEFQMNDLRIMGSVHEEAGAATPSVTTAVPTDIGQTSATVGGEVTSDGGATVTARGVVYNTTGMPTLSDSVLTIGSGEGSFSDTLSGLTRGQAYFVRAYATNSEGTAYGDEESFTTDCFDAPTGLTAIGESFEEFTAQWNSVTGATGYRLDVSEWSSFGVETILFSEDFAGFSGDGFASPPGVGQLDSANWVIRGMSDGDSTFGGTHASGDFARGSSSGGVTTGGAYGFEVGSGNMALGVQPTGSDFTPGDIVLRIQNTTGGTLTSIDVSYRIYVFNDQDRSSSWNFSHSADDSTYIDIGALDFTSPEPADGAPEWVGVDRAVTISGLNIAQNDYYYLRWSSDDVGGAGSRDELALNDVLVTANVPDFVDGFEDLPVAGTSQVVDGLEEDVEYFFRVRAVSDLCVSPNSDVESVTTLERPIPRISIDSLVHDESAYLAFGRVVTNYMFVYANDETLFAFDGSQGLDRVFEVTDAWLANLSDANDLQVHFGSWDPDFGLNRSANPPAGQEHLYTRMTIANWFTDNHAGFDLSRSSPDPVTSIAAATNVWRFTEPVDGALINNMMVDSNRISATIVNTVGGTRANQRFGWLNVIDDDTEPPQMGPTPLSVMLGDVPLPTAQQTYLVAGWNFNNADARTAVSHGSGSFLSNLGNALGSFGGSSLNLVAGDEAGSDISVTTDVNIGRYIQFEIDMTGLRDLQVSFAAQRSTHGYDNNTVSYSVNGGGFTTLQSDWSPGTSYGVHTFDLSGEPDVDGAASVVFRIEFGVNTATGAGNNRFDNFQFNATRTVHQITDAQLATMGAANPLRLTFNVYDVGSGIYRGTANDGLNMRVTVPGIAENNTANYVAGLSSAQTRSSESISVWEFENHFTPEEIGDLFEARYLPVTASVSDRDNDRPGDNLWLTDALFGVIEVIDDDGDPPEIRSVNFPNAVARPFMVLTNGAAYPSGAVIRGAQRRRAGTGASTVFKVSDYDLINSGTIGLQFAIGAVDLGSGIARGDAGTTETVMNFSIGDVIEGDVFIPAFNAGLSTASADAGQITTNVWTFPNGFFTVEMVNALIAAGPQPVLVTIPDTDNDRPGDASILYQEQVGILHVIDDDIRGPIIAAARVEGAVDENDGLFTAFESSEGWPAQISASPHVWTNVVGGRTWVGRGAQQAISPPILSGVRRIGLLRDAIEDPWLQLPPVRNPGLLTLYAGRTGGEDDDVVLRLEMFDGEDWVGIGDQVVDNLEPPYVLYVWDLDIEGEDVLLRVARSAGGASQVYIEDLSVIPGSGWISTNQLTLTWSEAVDDHHEVDEYRLVEPGFSTSVPTATNDGIRVASSLTNYVVDITGQQGELTGYLFAIDDDNDRPDDRAMGNIMRLIARVDTNPPIAISGLGVVEDLGIDDLSEVRLEWTPPGGSEAEGAGWRQSDSVALSPWRSYRIYYTSEARDPTLNDPFADVSRYAVLGDYDAETVVMTDFAFGTTYRMAIAGEDEAGNIGPLSDVITHQFASFIVTQGVAIAESESRIYWQAADGREYDLIFADANNYSENLNGAWQLADRAATNAINDTVSLNGAAMRFYRASPAGRWEPAIQVLGAEDGSGDANGSGSRRIASEEVYVARPIRLRRGQNWVALPGVPDRLTVGRAFQGAIHLPSGATALSSTRITWFDRASGVSTNRAIWLSDGEWKTNESSPRSAMDDLVDLADGVVIEIPQSATQEEYVFLFVGRVPSPAVGTHALEQDIEPNSAHNLISARLPRFMHPADLNLVEAGFKAGLGVSSTLGSDRGDGIWVLDRTAQGPAEIMYYNDGNLSATFPVAGWYQVGNGGAISANRVQGTPFSPDDAIVLRTFGSTQTWTWTNPIPYAAPTQFLDSF